MYTFIRKGTFDGIANLKIHASILITDGQIVMDDDDDLPLDQLPEYYRVQEDHFDKIRAQVQDVLRDRRVNRNFPLVHAWLQRNRYFLARKDAISAQKPFSHAIWDGRYCMMGRGSVPNAKLAQFYDLYAQSVDRGELLFFDERMDTDKSVFNPQQGCILVIDLDIHLVARFFGGRAFIPGRRLLLLAAVINYIVCKVIFKNSVSTRCVVIARDSILYLDKDQYVIKTGMHLYWPGIFLDYEGRTKCYWSVVMFLAQLNPSGHFELVPQLALDLQDSFSLREYVEGGNVEKYVQSLATRSTDRNVVKLVTSWQKCVDEKITTLPTARLPHSRKLMMKPTGCDCTDEERKTCDHVLHVDACSEYHYVTCLDEDGLEIPFYQTSQGHVRLADLLSDISFRPTHPRPVDPLPLSDQEEANLSRFAHKDVETNQAPPLSSEGDVKKEEALLKPVPPNCPSRMAIFNFCKMAFCDEIDLETLRRGHSARQAVYLARFRHTYCNNVECGKHKSNGSWLKVTKFGFFKCCFSMANEERSILGIPCKSFQSSMPMPLLLCRELFGDLNKSVRVRSKPYAPPPDLLPDHPLYSRMPIDVQHMFRRALSRYHKPVRDLSSLFSRGNVMNPEAPPSQSPSSRKHPRVDGDDED